MSLHLWTPVPKKLNAWTCTACGEVKSKVGGMMFFGVVQARTAGPCPGTVKLLPTTHKGAVR